MESGHMADEHVQVGRSRSLDPVGQVILRDHVEALRREIGVQVVDVTEPDRCCLAVSRWLVTRFTPQPCVSRHS